jgi:hypothetical protein
LIKSQHVNRVKKIITSCDIGVISGYYGLKTRFAGWYESAYADQRIRKVG